MNMTNEKSRAARQNARLKKLDKLLNTYFPGHEGTTWDRQEQKGFGTIPKTLAYIMEYMWLEKDRYLARTYFALWCNTWDDPLVRDLSEDMLALESGFTHTQTARRRYEWRKRIKRLEELGFIRTHKAGDGYQHILLLNPHVAIKKLLAQPDGEWCRTSDVRDELRGALRRRAIDIEADDLDLS
jgi:hypothetical protein